MDSISFTVERREFFGLLGLNGAVLVTVLLFNREPMLRRPGVLRSSFGEQVPANLIMLAALVGFTALILFGAVAVLGRKMMKGL